MISRKSGCTDNYEWISNHIVVVQRPHISNTYIQLHKIHVNKVTMTKDGKSLNRSAIDPLFTGYP